MSSKFTDAEIVAASIDLTEKIAALCAGKPTASVYIAISNVLGNMEMHAKRPDRSGVLCLISSGIDNFIRNNAN